MLTGGTQGQPYQLTIHIHKARDGRTYGKDQKSARSGRLTTGPFSQLKRHGVEAKCAPDAQPTCRPAPPARSFASRIKSIGPQRPLSCHHATCCAANADPVDPAPPALEPGITSSTSRCSERSTKALCSRGQRATHRHRSRVLFLERRRMGNVEVVLCSRPRGHRWRSSNRRAGYVLRLE